MDYVTGWLRKIDSHPASVPSPRIHPTMSESQYGQLVGPVNLAAEYLNTLQIYFLEEIPK